MDRRELLKLFGLTALGTSFVSCLTSNPAGAQEAHWGYIGESGPNSWGDLSPDYQACQIGQQQTPIDLQNEISADLDAIAINYQDTPLKLINNGHTVQVNYEPGSSITINDQRFNLVQFHFHHPSEHYVAGQPFVMELHMVHRNEAGQLAVLGVFLKEGAANDVLQTIWNALPQQAGSEQVVEGVMINAGELLPCDRAFYEYYGSLTTPPCSEGVLWVLMQQPIEVSSAQVQAFTRIFPFNARPIQPLNSRFILESR